jgi:hypothetical protein
MPRPSASQAKDRKGRVTFAGLAAYVSQEVAEGDKSVAKLIGSGAKQSPNLKADYSTEPVLLPVKDKVDQPRADDARVERKRPGLLDCTGDLGVSKDEECRPGVQPNR